MAYEITNSETGNTFTFASLEVYEAAEERYNSTEKGRIQEFCKSHGLDLNTSPIHLRPDWHDAAMELYARVRHQ